MDTMRFHRGWRRLTSATLKMPLTSRQKVDCAGRAESKYTNH